MARRGRAINKIAYSPRPGTGDTNDISAYWDGALLVTLGGSNFGSDHDWNVYSFDVVGGAGASSRLSFSATGISDSYGGSLDAVSLTTPAVPEPETYALMLAGLGAMAFVARRRKA